MKLMFIYIIIFLTTVTTAEALSPQDHEGLRWKLIDYQRSRYGVTEAVYELSLPKFYLEIEELEVFYVVTPLIRRENSPALTQPQEIYTKVLQGEHQTRRIKIFEGRRTRIELWAGAKIGNKFYTARTFFSSSSRSDQVDTQTRRLDAKPQWPSLGLILPKTNYFRARAGKQLSFTLNGENSNQAVVRLFENGREITTDLSRKPDGIINYTPPLDPIMTISGYSPPRDLLLVASTNVNGEEKIMSYYLPVYRAISGYMYLKPGLLVLATSVLLSLGWVYYRGRRFKW